MVLQTNTHQKKDQDTNIKSITKNKDAMTISQYLGRGQVSRGRATISKTLDMVVSTQPFFHNDGDKEAVIKGIENLQAALSGVEGLEWIQPPANQTAEDYVNSLLVTANARTSNHWMGMFCPLLPPPPNSPNCLAKPAFRCFLFFNFCGFFR